MWGDISLWFWFVSLMISAVGHVLRHLLAIHMSSLQKCLFRLFAQFFLLGYLNFSNRLYVFLYIFWILTLYKIHGVQIFFSHHIGRLFILPMTSFARQKLFLFWCSPACLFLISLLCFRCQNPKIIARTHFEDLFSYIFFLWV